MKERMELLQKRSLGVILFLCTLLIIFGISGGQNKVLAAVGMDDMQDVTCDTYEVGGNTCTPFSGRICSICGGNYDDGNICPHHEGEGYGDGDECTVTRYCDICGGNYDDGSECPHHIGEYYGGDECTLHTETWCSICGHSYYDNCPHISGEYYDDEYCEVYDVRVCDLCGGNYDDGNQCPHYEGEYYNQTECTVTRICNLCGGNYDDGSECPHHIGEIYNQDVCSVYDGRLCSICGYNYDDGGVCPHHEGESYDGDIYRVGDTDTYCSICHEPYYGGGCEHWEGYHYIVCRDNPYRTVSSATFYYNAIDIGTDLRYTYLDADAAKVYANQFLDEANPDWLDTVKDLIGFIPGVGPWVNTSIDGMRNATMSGAHHILDIANTGHGVLLHGDLYGWEYDGFDDIRDNIEFVEYNY